MAYTMYTPLNVWLDPASVTDVVAYIQNYLSENTIYSEEEIEELIHDYLIAHPELIGGVQSVNGKTGTVVLSASDINTANNVTIESVLASLSSQISSVAASVATNTSNITSLTGRVTTAETDISNLKSSINNGAAKLVVSNTVTQLDVANAVPFYAEGGDKITFSSVEGSTFTAQRIRFLDADKNNVAFYTLQANLSTQSATFPTGRNIVYWVMIEGGTAQEIFVLNETKNVVETIVKNAESNTHLIAKSSIYRANVWGTGVYIPFFADTGDTIKVETFNGENFSGTASSAIYFYNADKTQLSYWGIGAGYGKSRTFTYTNNTSSVYVAIRDTTDNIIVTNIARGNALIYSPEKNGITEKYITNDTKNDRKNVEKNADKTFVFFSDVHGASVCGQRVFEFANAVNADAIINGGDLVEGYISDNIDWYNSALTASDVDALMCLGNHDTWISDWTMAASIDVYNKFIAPMVVKVQNVIQPSRASQNGLCYYYKDYGTIRVIVIAAMSYTDQSMLWTSDQLTWFNSVLDDAKTNQKSVICVNHAPFTKASSDIDYDSQLNSWVNYKTFSSYDSIHLNDEAVAAVEAFISNGGEFICWLTGHTHADYIMKNGNQTAIVISTARYDRHFDGYSPTSASEIEDTNYDCFDYIGVDTTNKMVKVWRIGCNGDAAMKVRNRFSYDYANRKIIANS